eukprot:m.203390 g.203390  ORF g.203390 m.203390 type:complete len:924 (-) comp22112_c0_seq1:104-2875(-)
MPKDVQGSMRLQVLGLAGAEVSGSVLVTTEREGVIRPMYLFNAPEGLARAALEHRVLRPSRGRIMAVFLSGLSPTEASGLPGLILRGRSDGADMSFVFGPVGSVAWLHAHRHVLRWVHPELYAIEWTQCGCGNERIEQGCITGCYCTRRGRHFTSFLYHDDYMRVYVLGRVEKTTSAAGTTDSTPQPSQPTDTVDSTIGCTTAAHSTLPLPRTPAITASPLKRESNVTCGSFERHESPTPPAADGHRGKRSRTAPVPNSLFAKVRTATVASGGAEDATRCVDTPATMATHVDVGLAHLCVDTRGDAALILTLRHQHDFDMVRTHPVVVGLSTGQHEYKSVTVVHVGNVDVLLSEPYIAWKSTWAGAVHIHATAGQGADVYCSPLMPDPTQAHPTRPPRHAALQCMEQVLHVEAACRLLENHTVCPRLFPRPVVPLGLHNTTVASTCRPLSLYAFDGGKQLSDGLGYDALMTMCTMACQSSTRRHTHETHDPVWEDGLPCDGPHSECTQGAEEAYTLPSAASNVQAADELRALLMGDDEDKDDDHHDTNSAHANAADTAADTVQHGASLDPSPAATTTLPPPTTTMTTPRRGTTAGCGNTNTHTTTVPPHAPPATRSGLVDGHAHGPLEGTPRLDHPHVTLLGTGCAEPSKHRASSAILLECPLRLGGSKTILLDAGEGTMSRMVSTFGLASTRDKVAALACVWISHHHPDHSVGLLGVIDMYASVHPTGLPLMVIGPASVGAWIQETSAVLALSNRFVFFELATFVQQPDYMRLLHSVELAAFTSVPVDHCHDACGIVISAQSGWRLVYSGDTRPCARLVREGMHATLLIHEATFAPNMHHQAVAKRHCTVAEALAVAKEMRAHRVVLTHFSQRTRDAELARVSESAVAAQDGMCIGFHDLELLADIAAPMSTTTPSFTPSTQ